MEPEVVRGLERAVALEPDNAGLRLHLAQLLLEDGQIAAALGHCESILRVVADHEGAITLAGRARRAMGLPLTEPTPNRPVIARDAVEAPAAGDVTVDDLLSLVRPEVTLDDVAGMTAVKERLRMAFLEPMRNEELRRMYGASLRGGLLLYGPPGCGKTHLARALAGELGVYFVSTGLSDLLDRYLGDSEKNLHELFELARRNAPAVLFLDELDAIGHRRTRLRGDSGLRAIVNQLLLELDGLEDSNEGVFVLGATNQPWDIDPALRRPGRFDRQILVLPPDEPARRGILEACLAGRPTANIEVAPVADATDGYSGADLAHIVSSAVELAMADSVRSGSVRPVEQSDLEAALSEVKPSTGAWFESVRPFVQFSNDNGEYDELIGYLDRRRRRKR